MKLRWSFRAANDRGPQAESRVLFEAPKKTDTHLSVCLFLCFRYDFNWRQRNSTDVTSGWFIVPRVRWTMKGCDEQEKTRSITKRSKQVRRLCF